MALIPGRSWRCQLSNYLAMAEEANTQLIYEAKPDWWRGDMKVRIQWVVLNHRSRDKPLDGSDILGSAYGTPSDAGEGEQHNPILQQMLIRSNEANSSSVGRKLELHAGNDGIIGRTMSVEVQGQVIGEGIIGRL